jgi:hypothetical protein
MDIISDNKFQLIRQDVKILKKYLFNDNNINDWSKIIIIYNLYLFFNNLYICYLLIDYISNDTKNSSISKDFKNIYVFFFILCSLKSSYLYLIYNTSKIDLNLANSIYNNTKEYFI